MDAKKIEPETIKNVFYQQFLCSENGNALSKLK
jgi:hypothetical protein